MTDQYETATFAGGCFWCMIQPFQQRRGVLHVLAGYAGGKEKNPTYEQVVAHQTSHREAVQILYDQKKISYKKLLDIFWQQIDPTDSGGQFADRGESYTTAIFYHSEEQKKIAERSRYALKESKKFSQPIRTQILPYTTFYPAEEYHQDYYKKHPLQYKMYKIMSGRAGFQEKMWGKKKH